MLSFLFSDCAYYTSIFQFVKVSVAERGAKAHHTPTRTVDMIQRNAARDFQPV